MHETVPTEMKAAAIDRFGGPEVLHIETLPVPEAEGRTRCSSGSTPPGSASGTPYVRAGEFELGERSFPEVIGNDGAGEVVAVGSRGEALPRGRSRLRLRHGGRLLRRVRRR